MQPHPIFTPLNRAARYRTFFCFHALMCKFRWPSVANGHHVVLQVQGFGYTVTKLFCLDYYSYLKLFNLDLQVCNWNLYFSCGDHLLAGTAVLGNKSASCLAHPGPIVTLWLLGGRPSGFKKGRHLCAVLMEPWWYGLGAVPYLFA